MSAVTSETPVDTAPQLSKHTDPVASDKLSTDEKTETRDSGSVTDVEKDAAKPTAVLDESKILSGRKLFLAFMAMMLSVLLIALDQTIVAPALPVIASQFNSLDQIAWIASAYFLTQTAFLLCYGSFLNIFDRKYVYIAAVIWFEVGSLFCGVAPNVNFLIFGRAVAGVGAAGIFVSILSIIGEVTRLEDRPKLFGLFGAVFGFSSVVGPLLGGVFTDHVTWRWCFYINLPIGAVSVLFIVLIVPSTGRPVNSPEKIEAARQRWQTIGRVPNEDSILFRLAFIDYVGSVLMLGAVTSLLLAIQWGGDLYPWSSATVLGLLIGFAVITIILVIWEWKFAGINGLIPLHYFKNRTQVGTCLVAMCMFLSMLGVIYYLPLYFQAARGHSATQSGIDILAIMLSIVVGSIVVGGTVSMVGNYYYFMVFAPWLISIGAGLLFTIDENTSNAKLIGYQILIGVGMGAAMQLPIVAIQSNVEPEDLPTTTALVSFAQLFGGVLGIGICGTIFANKLSEALAQYAPDAPFDLVRHSAAAVAYLPESQRAGVIHAYVKAVDYVFLLPVAAGILASASATIIRNKNIKGQAMGGVA